MYICKFVHLYSPWILPQINNQQGNNCALVAVVFLGNLFPFCVLSLIFLPFCRNPLTANMCSKCYRDKQQKEKNANAPNVTAERGLFSVQSFRHTWCWRILQFPPLPLPRLHNLPPTCPWRSKSLLKAKLRPHLLPLLQPLQQPPQPPQPKERRSKRTVQCKKTQQSAGIARGK